MLGKQQLLKVLAFFKLENLLKHEIKYDGDVALLVVDVQQEFCDPKQSRGNRETKLIARRIQSLVPEFRKASIPVYAIYSDWEGKERQASDIDFYQFTPAAADTLVSKIWNSAFQETKLKSLLKRAGRKSLLVCGFNLNACVKETVMDARKNGFDVTLLIDMAGNDNCCRQPTKEFLDEMLAAGTHVMKADAVLKQIDAVRTAAAAPRV